MPRQTQDQPALRNFQIIFFSKKNETFKLNYLFLCFPFRNNQTFLPNFSRRNCQLTFPTKLPRLARNFSQRETFFLLFVGCEKVWWFFPNFLVGVVRKSEMNPQSSILTKIVSWAKREKKIFFFLTSSAPVFFLKNNFPKFPDNFPKKKTYKKIKKLFSKRKEIL